MPVTCDLSLGDPVPKFVFADLVELVMALEEAFDITVEESELDGVDTVAGAYALVTGKL